MTKKAKISLIILLLVNAALLALVLWLVVRPEWNVSGFALLNPKGQIASQQRQLIITATLLMLIVVIPVYFLIFYLPRKYSANKTTEKYDPNFDNNKIAILIWLIPGSIIAVIAGIIWKSTHALDPRKPIQASVKPLTIQVVSLQWKWLFIYPEQNIASVNFVQFPEDTPLNFELTADSPMNTFWIPQLGGQIYMMEGMKTKLHLMADSPGEFSGQSSEISGEGYSGMTFVAKATSPEEFDSWVKSVKTTSPALSPQVYDELAKPSENRQRVFYSTVAEGLFSNIVMKFMMPAPPASMPMEHK